MNPILATLGKIATLSGYHQPEIDVLRQGLLDNESAALAELRKHKVSGLEVLEEFSRGVPSEVVDTSRLRTAATVSLLDIARVMPNDFGMEALQQALGPKGFSHFLSASALATDLGLTTAPASLVSLLGAAREKLSLDMGEELELRIEAVQSGLPFTSTRLTPSQMKAVREELNSLPQDEFGFAHDVVIPDRITWEALDGNPGVAQGRALRLKNDPQDGSVVVPILMSAGAIYFEHGHVGPERAIFIEGSGPVRDQIGTNTSVSAEYNLAPGTFHMPFVPFGAPAIFFGVARYGIVPSGFGLRPRAGELLKKVGAKPEDIARLFQEIPVDKPSARQTPRADFARGLFRRLDFLDIAATFDPESGAALGEILQKAVSLTPANRVLWANSRELDQDFD
jgi:hypothetical protein